MTDPQPPIESAAAVDDSEGGAAMFYVFTAAVLIVTGTVVLIALINTWWVLGAVVAFHLTMTAVVTAVIMKVMDGTAWVKSISASTDSRHDDSRGPTRQMATV